MRVHVHELLPAGARPALERALAKPLSYAARYLIVPGPRPRALVVLGEAHVKLSGASKLGRDVVRCFPLRGVESFQRKQVLAGVLLGHLIEAPRRLLRLLSLGAVHGSTITDAKELTDGVTVELERTDRVPASLHAGSIYLVTLFALTYATLILGALGIEVRLLQTISSAFSMHLVASVPAYLLRRKPWAWMLQPAIAILTTRDALLVAGTVRMLQDHPGPDAAVVVMGRAHVGGYVEALVEQHGFVVAEM